MSSEKILLGLTFVFTIAIPTNSDLARQRNINCATKQLTQTIRAILDIKRSWTRCGTDRKTGTRLLLTPRFGRPRGSCRSRSDAAAGVGRRATFDPPLGTEPGTAGIATLRRRSFWKERNVYALLNVSDFFYYETVDGEDI